MAQTQQLTTWREPTGPKARRAWLAATVMALATLALVCLGPAVAQAQAQASTNASAKQEQSYQRAIDGFKRARYAEAYGRVIDAADAGHLPSARLALLIVQNGPALFNTEFSATPGQVGRWQALVVNAARRQVYVGADARTTE